MKFEKVTAGMVLYDVHSYRMGNTTMRSMGCWPVEVISVDSVKGTAQCSWNGNPPTIYFERDFKKLRAKEPVMVGTIMGGRRLLRRGEKPPEDGPYGQ